MLRVIDGGKETAKERVRKFHDPALTVFHYMKATLGYLRENKVLPETVLTFEMFREGMTPREAELVIQSLLEMNYVLRVKHTRLVLTPDGREFADEIAKKEEL